MGENDELAPLLNAAYTCRYVRPNSSPSQCLKEFEEGVARLRQREDKVGKGDKNSLPETRGPYLRLTLPTFAFEDRGPGASYYDYLSHPEMASSIVDSGVSLANFVANQLPDLANWFARQIHGEEKAAKMKESEKWQVFLRVLAFTPKVAAALVASYLKHEHGHIYMSFNEDDSLDDQISDIADVLSTAAGINASLWSARELMMGPYEGVVSDLAYAALKWDLLFYDTVSTPYINSQVDDERLGDTQEYLQFRSEQSGNREDFWLTLLGFWLAADTVHPFGNGGAAYRAAKYGLGGGTPNNPRAPGNWTLATTGALAPTGPLYGLRFYYFMNGVPGLPSAIFAEVMSSPVTQGNTKVPLITEGDTDLPLVVQVGARRFNLPKMGPVTLGLSGSLTYSRIEANDWQKVDAPPHWPTSMLAGSAGLHLQTRYGEIFATANGKQPGFEPGRPWEYGTTQWGTVSPRWPSDLSWETLVGVRLNPGNWF